MIELQRQEAALDYAQMRIEQTDRTDLADYLYEEGYDLADDDELDDIFHKIRSLRLDTP
ncbi:hypothetical protein [Brevibacterium moorei]|uniref:hypothetical protein n=1 Tax=Brevibacterium moorei TaxID=2968457 RepID=UPI00211BBD3E|nr:hypothetical protein [Brevibacterium sp. 68QC2CO]MCQ9385155.1 hypothetical protein [Brevibacterium sp. 68QC2CO]